MLGKRILNRQCQTIGATEEKKKISYSEFRVMLGKQILIDNDRRMEVNVS
jgi:hypothetical protein